MILLYVSQRSIDDLLNAVFRRLLKVRSRINPSKGAAAEIRGVLLRLRDPRARLSRTETKGTIFSCLGEFLWYMSGRSDAEMITYYIPKYKKSAEEDGRVNGAYGPRLYRHNDADQLTILITALKKRDSRKAIIQLFDARDLSAPFKDVPCTCTIQFFARGQRLDAHAHMRSNDAYFGLPHDIFCFTMLQEYVARIIGKEVGEYIHSVGSLHLYDIHREKAHSYLNEGFQPTSSMPAMPVSNVKADLDRLLRVESDIRTGKTLPSYADLPSYWRDLATLLEIMSLTRGQPDRSALKRVVELKRHLSDDYYVDYIRRRTARHDELINETLPLFEDENATAAR